jgi:hypothetical protein
MAHLYDGLDEVMFMKETRCKGSAPCIALQTEFEMVETFGFCLVLLW